MPDELTRIKEFLKKNTRGMNIREIADAIHVNRNSVAKYLDILTTREEVEVKVFGKSKVYYLSQHVPVSALIRFSSSLMVILNRDLQIVKINDAGLRYLNRPRESVIGMPIRDIHPDMALNDSIQGWCMEALQGKETDGEIHIPDGGSGRFFRIVFTPTVFPDNTRGVILLFEDITERKTAEALLKKSEEKYRRFIETANEGICAVDRNFIITFANQKMADILGCSIGEITGRHIADAMHPDEKDDIEIKRQNRLVGKKEIYERRLIRKNGSVGWFLISVTPMMAPDGTFDGSLAMLTDITERKVAEKALRESEKRFRHLIDYVPGLAVQGYYLDGTTFYWNKASENLYGFTAEEAIGKNLLDLIIPPEMQDDVRGAITWMAESGQPIPSADLSLMRKDKSRVDVFSGHAIVRVLGQPPQLFCMDIDLTERKKAEQAIRESEYRFQQVADNADEWIWEIDTDGLYRYCSSAVTRIIGYTPEELAGRMHYYDLFPQSHRDELTKKARAAIDRQEPLRRFVNPAVHKNGNIVILETSGSPVYDHDGVFSGFRGCDTDLTERWKLETARQAALEQIEKNILQLTVLSDRVRNPLTAILAYAGMASPEAEEKIGSQVMAIDQIISDIDKGWYESEQVRSQLRKYYEIDLPVEGGGFENSRTQNDPGSR